MDNMPLRSDVTEPSRLRPDSPSKLSLDLEFGIKFAFIPIFFPGRVATGELKEDVGAVEELGDTPDSDSRFSFAAKLARSRSSKVSFARR
jgi:hypothetical protein